MFRDASINSFVNNWLDMVRANINITARISSYSIQVSTNVIPQIGQFSLFYTFTLVVVYNNLLVTLVTQKIVVDRPL